MTDRRPAAAVPRMLAAALDAARIGHVLPLRPFTKIPALNDWEHRSTQDPDRIRELWTGRPWNVGLACGPSRLHILDLDDAHACRPPHDWPTARHGRDVLAQVADAAGEQIPATFAVRTPHQGQHLYFHTAGFSDELRSTVARLGWRIDSRGAGGYVVAAGSVLPSGTYRAANDHPILALPLWLAHRLTTPTPEPSLHVARHRPHTPADHRRITAYVDRVITSVTHAQPGQRHDILLRAAFTLGRLVAGKDLDADEAETRLQQAAQPFIGVRDWTAAQGRDTIADGLAAGKNQPRALSAEP